MPFKKYHKVPLEWRQAVSKARKGIVPKTAFAKGRLSPFKGKTLNQIYGKERAKKIREKQSKIKKGKVSWNKGRKLSIEYRQRLSEAHKGQHPKTEFRKGYIMLEETKNKISKNLKGNVHGFKKGNAHPYFGKSSPMKGKKHSDETKQKMREKRLILIIPFKDTSIEVKLQKFLKELNIPFEKHKAILGQPDLFIEPNVCIFADGCYWHGCEICFDKNKFNLLQQKARVRDILITEKLKASDYVVLRLWEHEINKMRLDYLEKYIEDAIVKKNKT